MSRNKAMKVILALVFLIITIVFIVLDNEIIFPSSLVALLLVLTLMGDSRVASNGRGKSAQWTIITFAILVSLLNIIVPLSLPAIVSGMDVSHYNLEMTSDLGTRNPQMIKDHFIEVTINDMHELCYSTGVLLLINLLFLFLFRRKNQSTEILDNRKI